METFGQQNYPRLKLGNTPYTFARYGCLSDVVIMGYDWLFHKKATPEELVPKLNYDKDGNLLWPSLNNLGMELKVRVAYTKTPYNTINKWWSNQDVCCALEINYGTHFVWQIGRYIEGLGYRVFDPFTNKITYQKNNITGCRIFGKK